MKILLAEDDTNISTIAILALEQIGGHKVEHASDGALALSMALNGKYDVILLDEMMPKMSGLIVAQEYRRQAVDQVPIIFLSAKSQETDIHEFNKMGLGHIPKPFDPTRLSAQIEKLLMARGSRRSSA